MHDHLGTTRAIADSNGVLCYAADYFPFGAEIGVTNTCAQNYKFTGKERDSESGLDYFTARYYGSSMGRFMSPDDFGGHLEDPQTLNKYAYAGNNPLRYTDPGGHDFWQSCATASATCGNQVIGKGTDGKDITQLVSGTTDSNGKFTATVVTSASLGQAGSGNTAAVNGSGVQITTGTGTSSQQTGQGIFIANTPAADIQGQGTGWNQFSFHIDSNDVAHGVVDSGTATYNGSGGHQGMLDAINSMKAGSNGPWQYPGEDHYNGFHPGATELPLQYRRSSCPFQLWPFASLPSPRSRHECSEFPYRQRYGSSPCDLCEDGGRMLLMLMTLASLVLLAAAGVCFRGESKTLIRSRKVLFLSGSVGDGLSVVVLLIFLAHAYRAAHGTAPVDLDRLYPVFWMFGLGVLAVVLSLFGRRLSRVLLFGSGLLATITWYLAALAVSP